MYLFYKSKTNWWAGCHFYHFHQATIAIKISNLSICFCSFDLSCSILEKYIFSENVYIVLSYLIKYHSFLTLLVLITNVIKFAFSYNSINQLNLMLQMFLFHLHPSKFYHRNYYFQFKMLKQISQRLSNVFLTEKCLKVKSITKD